MLYDRLERIDWNETEINQSIRDSSTNIGINRRDAYIALYLLILGTDYGPRIASIMNEIGKESTLNIFSKSFQ